MTTADFDCDSSRISSSPEVVEHPEADPNTKAAVDRVAAKRIELGAEDFGAYVFLALGLLAQSAPEVVQFILDVADLEVS